MYPYHINDPEFANALVDSFLEISENGLLASSSSGSASSGSSQDHVEKIVPEVSTTTCGTIAYTPSDFPDAKPGLYSSSSLSYLIYNLV